MRGSTPPPRMRPMAFRFTYDSCVFVRVPSRGGRRRRLAGAFGYIEGGCPSYRLKIWNPSHGRALKLLMYGSLLKPAGGARRSSGERRSGSKYVRDQRLKRRIRRHPDLRPYPVRRSSRAERCHPRAQRECGFCLNPVLLVTVWLVGEPCIDAFSVGASLAVPIRGPACKNKEGLRVRVGAASSRWLRRRR